MAKRKVRNPTTLEEYLGNLTVPELKKLTLHVGKNLPTRKADVIAVILETMQDPAALRALWDELDAFQQAAIVEVVHSQTTRFNEQEFRAKYGESPDWGEQSRWGQIEKPSKLSLFFFRNEMPRDLKENLRAFVPRPRSAEIAPSEPPQTVEMARYEWDSQTLERKRIPLDLPVVRRDTERMARHDLLAVLRLIDTGTVRVSNKTQRPTAASVRAVAEVLEGGDFYPPPEPIASDEFWSDSESVSIRAFAWPLIVQSAGLAEPAGAKLQLTARGQKALTAPPHQTLRRAWRRWLKTALLDEFNRVHTIKGQTGKGKRQLTAPAKRRDAIVAALQEMPPHEWVAFDEFSRFMRASGNTFEVTRDLWTLYIEDSHYGSLGYAGFGEWHVVQARYLLVFLFEYAATLGLIDVAYIPPNLARFDFGNLWGVDDLACLSYYDGLLYFRLNNLGAWCLGLVSAYAPPAEEERDALRVLPNFDIVAVEPLPPGDVLLIEQFAEKTDDMVWCIQPNLLLEALEGGLTIDEIERFLRAKASHDLPDPLTTLLQETAERASALLDRGEAQLIEVNSAALAQMLAQGTRLRNHCMLAGERHIVIPPESRTAFRRELHKLGYAMPTANP